MRFVAVRETALSLVERFKTQGSLDVSQRTPLISAASASEERRLQQDLVDIKRQDEDPAVDLRLGRKGQLETRRGPQPNESFERTVHTRAEIAENEMSRFQEATLQNESEPYQEIFEFTRYGQSGIEHVSVTVHGDAVGVGGIHSVAEFISPDHTQSWRERTYQDFHNSDLISIYQQGTY